MLAKRQTLGPLIERTSHVVRLVCDHHAPGEGHGPCACFLRRLPGFETRRLAACDHIEGLKRSGVVFEDDDFSGLKTVNHVCVLGAEKAAWFKDTEGNYLRIHEDIPPV